jgi:hypothetical protein
VDGGFVKYVGHHEIAVHVDVLAVVVENDGGIIEETEHIGF